MKEVKLGGHPIKAYSKDALTNYLGQYRVTKWIVLILLAAAIGLIYIIGPDALAEFEESLLLIIGLPVLFVILGINALRSEIKIKKELQRRAADSSEFTQMIGDAKQSSKGLLFITACIIVVAMLVTIPIAWLLNFSGSEKETCKNCGRAEKLVAGFGYCETCYEGFVDWQDNNWKDDNRGN